MGSDNYQGFRFMGQQQQVAYPWHQQQQWAQHKGYELQQHHQHSQQPVPPPPKRYLFANSAGGECTLPLCPQISNATFNLMCTNSDGVTHWNPTDRISATFEDNGANPIL
ncbi:hypothetical protein J6590_076807 [Homalodisca vitripennis]|nr:hypothetical protein J6590_076807 [Homalodisca vitripennis]